MKIFPKGFTLLEMMVVVLIISILVAIGLPVYQRSVERSKAVEAFEILSNIRSKQEERKNFGKGERGQYTMKFSDLGDVVAGISSTDDSFIRTKYFDYNLYSGSSEHPGIPYAAAVRLINDKDKQYAIKMTNGYLESALCCDGPGCYMVEGVFKGCQCAEGYTRENNRCVGNTSNGTCLNLSSDDTKCCKGELTDGRFWDMPSGPCRCPDHYDYINGVCVIDDCKPWDGNGFLYSCCKTGSSGDARWKGNGICECPNPNYIFDPLTGKCSAGCPSGESPVSDSGGNTHCCPSDKIYYWWGDKCQVCQTAGEYPATNFPSKCCPENKPYYDGATGQCVTALCAPPTVLIDDKCCPDNTYYVSNGHCCKKDPLYTWDGTKCSLAGGGGEEGKCPEGEVPAGPNGERCCPKDKPDWKDNIKICCKTADVGSVDVNGIDKACCPASLPQYVASGSVCCQTGFNYFWGGKCQKCKESDAYTDPVNGKVCACGGSYPYGWNGDRKCHKCPETTGGKKTLEIINPKTGGTVCCQEGQELNPDTGMCQDVNSCKTCECLFKDTTEILKCKCFGNVNPKIKAMHTVYNGDTPVKQLPAWRDDLNCCKLVPKASWDGTVCDECSDHLAEIKLITR